MTHQPQHAVVKVTKLPMIGENDRTIGPCQALTEGQQRHAEAVEGRGMWVTGADFVPFLRQQA
jgi:hypothetical protein